MATSRGTSLSKSPLPRSRSISQTSPSPQPPLACFPSRPLPQPRVKPPKSPKWGEGGDRRGRASFSPPKPTSQGCGCGGGSPRRGGGHLRPGPLRVPPSPFSALGTMASPAWREAATLLLAAGGRQPPGPPAAAFDYQVLLLRRSARSAFLPSAQVFPGGVADASDFSPAWRELLPNAPRCGLGAQPPARPPLFAARRPELGEASLPADVAFRICAIRETFEESGLLLLVPAEEAAARTGGTAALLPAERLRLLPAGGLEEWRRRVQGDPGSFLQLCRLLGCVPHLRALHEWGNWLSPVHSPGQAGRRYDTAFYLCCCFGQEPPAASHDRQEVVDCRWSTPLEAVELFNSGEVWIAPPQLYELCRLCHFSSLHDLERFSSERALEGCERWMSVMLMASDGYIQLLPGDDLYPKDPDFTGEKKPLLTTTKNIEEVMKEGRNLHRIVIRSLNNVTIHMNIESKYKHINPVRLDSKM